MKDSCRYGSKMVHCTPWSGLHYAPAYYMKFLQRLQTLWHLTILWTSKQFWTFWLPVINLLVWVNNTWLLEAKNPESANIFRWQNHEYRSKYHLLVSRGVPCDKVNADGLPLCRRSFHVLKTSSPYVGSISGLHLLRYSFICQSRQKIKNVQYYQ